MEKGKRKASETHMKNQKEPSREKPQPGQKKWEKATSKSYPRKVYIINISNIQGKKRGGGLYVIDKGNS